MDRARSKVGRDTWREEEINEPGIGNRQRDVEALARDDGRSKFPRELKYWKISPTIDLY